jgi:hypothetical protein
MQMTSLGTSLCCICQVFDKKWEYNVAILQLFMDVPTAYDAIRRVILYNILMEFGLPPLDLPVGEAQLSKEEFGVSMELVRFIKVNLKFKPIVQSG